MTTTTRQSVTDLLVTPTARTGEMVRVDAPPVRECFVRPIPRDELDDPVRTSLQTLINENSRNLCVCSPNREDMLRTRAEMQAHPGYADYKARRDAAMGRK